MGWTGRSIVCDQVKLKPKPFVAYVHECDHCHKNFFMEPKKQTRAMKGNKWRPAFKHSFCCRLCRYEWSSNHAKGGSVKVIYRKNKNGKITGVIRIYVPKKERCNHSLCDNRGYMFEHRYKIENILGRKLTKDETIHHRDGNPFNNDINNLELRSGNHGRGATSYTEEVNRLISMLPKLIDASFYSLSEYAKGA